jgi:hypothetical protein
MTKRTNNHTIQARIATELRDEFFKKAEEFGGGSLVMRELVTAFVEDRITIRPSEVKSKLYELQAK